MRLDLQRQAAAAKRRGQTGRTILAVIWFILSFVIAYYLTGWLNENDIVTTGFLYNQFGISRTVDPLIVRGAFMVVIVIVMQFFTLLGYAFTSRAGRTRPGDASLYSRNPDPVDRSYDDL